MRKIKEYSGFIVMIASIFVFGLMGKSTEMGMAVVASALLLVFLNLEKFSKFKGAGFEAELRGKIDEADIIIKQLKELAISLISTNLDILSDANRVQGSSFENDHKLFYGLVKLSKSLNIKDESVDDSIKRYRNIKAWDMVNSIATDVFQNIGGRASENFFNQVEEKIGKAGFSRAPDIKKFRGLLKDENIGRTYDEKLSKIENFLAEVRE